MKIVDITEFYSERGGGIRSHLTTRGHFLCQRHHDHVVIAPGAREDDAWTCGAVADEETGAEQSGTPAARPKGSSRVVRLAGPALPYDRTYHLLGRFDKVRKRVLAERPDVLEAHSPYLATAAIVACGRHAARVKTAFWHTDHVGAYLEPPLARILGPERAHGAVDPVWRALGVLLAPFDATFVAGRGQAQRLRAAGVRRVTYVPFGVDKTTFHPGARSEAWRREWLAGAPEGTSILVGVGRFAVEKRWDVVLDAFARLRTRYPAILVLYGDGPERRRLEARAPEGVHFPGFERDRVRLATALASADVLVHGGPYETFGLGIAEAIACGLPVVAPDTGGAGENVNRSCGETYRRLDPHACVAALELILSQDRVQLRARALSAASTAPTLEEHFDTVLRTYAEILDEKERARSRV